MYVPVIGQPRKKFMAKKLSGITQNLEESEAMKAVEVKRIKKRQEDLEDEIRRRAEESAAKAKADQEATYKKATASLPEKSIPKEVEEMIGALVGIESKEEHGDDVETETINSIN